MTATRTVEPFEIEDYPAPACQSCECGTEPIYVLDEDEHKSLALKGTGFCLGCDTLIVEVYKGAEVITEVVVRSPLD